AGASWLPAKFAFHHSLPRRSAHGASLRARTGQDARLDEFLRERRKVALGEWLRSDGPDGTAVAARISADILIAAVFSGPVTLVLVPATKNSRCLSQQFLWSSKRLLNSLGVVVIPRALGKQENVLMRPRRPIRHALGHRVGLCPDDVAAQIPAVSL